jgi:hypothetical protein
MTVPRDVILDLLPLYLADEASPATRELVENYLKQDPALAQRVREQRGGLVLPETAGPPPELELRSLRRTRRMLTWQRWMFGLGLSATILSFSVVINFEGARPVEAHMVMRDLPLPFGLLLVVGLASLSGYFILRRRLGTHKR